jgi:hypothetical protein
MEQTSLSFTAICTLFFYGFFSEILLSQRVRLFWIWFFHFSWNRAKFSGIYVSATHVLPLKEAEIFNLLEGSWVSVLLCISAGVLALRLKGTRGASQP